jgi:hypothetical protein
MPLETGKSKAAFSHNVEVEVAAGKPKRQAVAIAYSKQRGDKRRGRDTPKSELRKAIRSGEEELEHQKAALLEVDCSLDEDDVEVDCSDSPTTQSGAADRAPPVLAFDRSMRSKDVDGRLHVKNCKLTKANICPYLGKEIPDSETLKLDPDHIYYMYRDASALEQAASTMERVPLMIMHVASTATDPQKMLIVGTVSNVRWMAPYLVGDLTVWDQKGIDLIESEQQKELSPGYHYTPMMQSGTADGQHYDGIMLRLKFNHMCLVDTGRTGPDVMVADGAIRMTA